MSLFGILTELASIRFHTACLQLPVLKLNGLMHILSELIPTHMLSSTFIPRSYSITEARRSPRYGILMPEVYTCIARATNHSLFLGFNEPWTPNLIISPI